MAMEMACRWAGCGLHSGVRIQGPRPRVRWKVSFDVDVGFVENVPLGRGCA